MILQTSVDRSYQLRLEKDNEGMIVLRATCQENGDEINILGIDRSGITVFDVNGMDGLPTSFLRDAHGNSWGGITMRFDATAIHTDNIKHIWI